MRALIDMTFASYGRKAPADLHGLSFLVAAMLSLLFVVTATIILLCLNFFSIFIGVVINFLGREGLEFHFIRIFRRVPVIAVSLPVLFAYASWHHSLGHGLIPSLLPMLLVWLLGAVLIALAAFWTGARGA